MFPFETVAIVDHRCYQTAPLRLAQLFARAARVPRNPKRLLFLDSHYARSHDQCL